MSLGFEWKKGETHFKHGNVKPERDITPKAVEKDQRKKARLDADYEGTKEAQKRSGGRCEIRWFGKKSRRVKRCERPIAPGIHHMIGGWGKRARGISCLAIHKQAVCQECHDLITSKRLRRIGGDVPMWTDEYERVDR